MTYLPRAKALIAGKPVTQPSVEGAGAQNDGSVQHLLGAAGAVGSRRVVPDECSASVVARNGQELPTVRSLERCW